MPKRISPIEKSSRFLAVLACNASQSRDCLISIEISRSPSNTCEKCKVGEIGNSSANLSSSRMRCVRSIGAPLARIYRAKRHGAARVLATPLISLFRVVSVFSKGQCETVAYRFLGKRGGYAWIVTQATLIHCSKQQKPLSVVCVNYVLR